MVRIGNWPLKRGNGIHRFAVHERPGRAIGHPSSRYLAGFTSAEITTNGKQCAAYLAEIIKLVSLKSIILGEFKARKILIKNLGGGARASENETVKGMRRG